VLGPTIQPTWGVCRLLIAKGDPLECSPGIKKKISQLGLESFFRFPCWANSPSPTPVGASPLFPVRLGGGGLHNFPHLYQIRIVLPCRTLLCINEIRLVRLHRDFVFASSFVRLETHTQSDVSVRTPCVSDNSLHWIEADRRSGPCYEWMWGFCLFSGPISQSPYQSFLPRPFSLSSFLGRHHRIMRFQNKLQHESRHKDKSHCQSGNTSGIIKDRCGLANIDKFRSIDFSSAVSDRPRASWWLT
jgi:hypothetical protein